MPGTELLVINPRPRRKTRRPMTALQRKYFGGKRKKKHVRVTRAKRNPTSVRAMAPIAKRYRKRRSVRSAARSFTRSVRSVGRGFGGIENLATQTLLPAAIGAGGALAVDLAWGYLPLPAALQTGVLAPVARIAGSIGIGMAASMVAGKRVGNQVLSGALTVTMYDLIKGYLKTNYTSLPLSAYLPPRGRLGVYLGEYTPDYVNEATQDHYEYAD